MDRTVFYCFFASLLFPREAELTFYPTIFWNPNNCRFKLNGQNMKEYFFKVKPMSNMVFACPHYALWADKSDASPQRTMMYENLLLVDEESYKTCSIKNSTQVKQILRCDSDPWKDLKFSEEYFTSYQADSDQTCYKMGQSYYFISTADGSKESINNTKGGHCETHHMKLRVYVCNATEPCEFQLPQCPKGEGEEQDEEENAPTPNVPDKTATASAQSGVKEWFSTNHHLVWHAVMGLVILVLLVIIVWLCYGYRKDKRFGRSNEKKVANEKELLRC